MYHPIKQSLIGFTAEFVASTESIRIALHREWSLRFYKYSVHVTWHCCRIYNIWIFILCLCCLWWPILFINSWKCIYCTKRILILEKNKLSETLISMSQTFEIGSWQGQKLSFILDRLWSLHAHKGSYINHVNSWGGGGFSQMTSL